MFRQSTIENTSQRVYTKLNRFWGFILMFSLLQGAHAQEQAKTGTITGRVLNAVTREPIPSANIIVVGTGRGAASDLDGLFTIQFLPAGTYHLKAGALGYREHLITEVAVSPGRIRTVDFLLEPTVLQGDEVTYTKHKQRVVTSDMPTSSRNMRYEEVRRAPGALEDVQRTLQGLPGVVTQDDNDNAIIVRGGAPNENLTIIDGIEVNNTNHLTIGNEGQGSGGPINGLNTEFLQDVTFASGGFSAKHGDRMSSVLDLEMREGNRDRFGGEVDLGMSGAGGYAEGPLPGKQGSFLVSIKKAYLELLPEEAAGVSSWPDYWSTQAKVTYDLSPRHKLTVNALYLDDVVENSPSDEDLRKMEDEEDNDGLRLNTERHFYGARLRSLWGAGYTDIVLARSVAYTHWEYYEMRDRSAGGFYHHRELEHQRTDIADQFHFRWNGKAFGQDTWAAGFSLKPVTYEYTYFAEGDSIIYNDDYLGVDAGTDPDTFYYDDHSEDLTEHALKYASYLQYTWKPMHHVALTLGLRHDGIDYAHQNAIGPRASVVWEVVPRWTVSAAYGVYFQSQDESVYMNEAGRRWNRELPYSRADQYIFGVNYQPRESSFFSLEGYLKDYTDLLVEEEEVVRVQTGDDRFQSDRWLTEKTKQAWGVEFFAQQKLFTNWYGTLSYSYGESEAKDPAYGTYSPDYDYRHVLSSTLGYKTALITHSGYRNFLHKPWGWWLWALPLNGDEITFSTRYRYMSGRPYTDMVWYAEGQDSPDPIYEAHWENGEHNGSRFPDYSRWDIRIDDKHYFGSSALILYLEMQNVLDWKNVASYSYKENGEKETNHQMEQFWILGVRYEF